MRQLTTYECRDDLKTKFVAATNPLSAIKKAFRTSYGHWEEAPYKTSTFVVMGKKIVGYYRVEDHG